MLPELSDNPAKAPNTLDGEFTAADTVLDLPGTLELLKNNHLMIEDVDLSTGVELLR